VKSFLKKCSFVLIGLIFWTAEIYGQEICHSPFIPNTSKDRGIESLLERFWKESAGRSGFILNPMNAESRQDRISSAKKANCSYYVEFQYTITSDKTYRYFAQIYNPSTGMVIDGQSYSSDLFSSIELEGIQLDPKEIRESDTESVRKFIANVTNSIKSNPKKTERYQNIVDHVYSSPIAKQESLEIAERSLEEQSKDVFQLLQEGDESISIVSKRVSGAESSRRTPAVVSVISESKIRNSGARNLADVLKSLPGIEIYYNQFGYYEVSVRGIKSKSGVLLLVDGHRINNFYDGSTFLDLRADIIQKIEVIRGPGSSVHGTNAFVGVINVITKEPQESKHIASSSFRYGSHSTIEPSVIFGKNITDSFRINGYVSKYESQRPKIHIENDITCTPTAWRNNECNTTLVPLPLNRSITTNDRKDQLNASLTLNYKENYYINTKVINEKRGPNVGELAEVTPESESKFNFLIGDMGIRNLELLDWLSMSIKVYGDRYNRNDDTQVQRPDRLSHLGNSPRERVGYQFETQGIESILQFEITKNLLFLLGTQFEKLRVYNYFIEKNYLRTDTDAIQPFFFDFDGQEKKQNDNREIRALFGELSYEPFRWLSVTLGLRYDEYSDFGKTLNPKGGLVLVPMESKDYGAIYFKILYGEAFRAPTFQELYDQTQAFKAGGVFGNSEILPETVETFEASMEYHTPYKPLLFLLNGYYNTIKDNIAALNNSGTFPSERDRYKNLNGIRVIGGELETRLNFDPRTYFFLNVSWFQAQDFGGFPPNENRITKTFLLDIPQGRLNFGSNFEITRYLVWNNTIWVSSERFSNSRFAFERQEDRKFSLPQYHIWNFSLSTTEDLWSDLFLQLNVFNVQDFRLMDPSPFALPAFQNRSYPSTWIYGRYVEVKLTYNL